MRDIRKELIEMLIAEVKPAVGCTEPVAVALACAKAKELLGEDVVKNKGITRSEFDKMLNAHKKESKNGINETQEYINNLSFAKRRRYNTALGNILETQQSESLRLIKIKIYNYIMEHEDSLDDIESYLKEISKLFDDDFDVEFTDDMKSVQYIMIYYMYASGGTL